MLQKFNKNQSIDLVLKRRIEDYFEYKWIHDKNHAFENPEEQRLFMELPQDTQIMIFRNYLYRDFLKSFRRFFTIRNPAGQWPSFFTWDN